MVDEHACADHRHEPDEEKLVREGAEAHGQRKDHDSDRDRNHVPSRQVAELDPRVLDVP